MSDSVMDVGDIDPMAVAELDAPPEENQDLDEEQPADDGEEEAQEEEAQEEEAQEEEPKQLSPKANKRFQALANKAREFETKVQEREQQLQQWQQQASQQFQQMQNYFTQREQAMQTELQGQKAEFERIKLEAEERNLPEAEREWRKAQRELEERASSAAEKKLLARLKPFEEREAKERQREEVEQNRQIVGRMAAETQSSMQQHLLSGYSEKFAAELAEPLEKLVLSRIISTGEKTQDAVAEIVKLKDVIYKAELDKIARSKSGTVGRAAKTPGMINSAAGGQRAGEVAKHPGRDVLDLNGWTGSGGYFEWVAAGSPPLKRKK